VSTSKCLNDNRSPIDQATKKNLEFLIELRHEIEHRSTNRIDDSVSAKLQACCINFNEAIKTLFGRQYNLETRLPLALQFITFSADQRALLKGAGELRAHIETMMDTFHEGLTEEEQASLLKLTERYCVVFQTLKTPAAFDVTLTAHPA